MTSVVRIGDRLWLTRVDRDPEESAENTYGTEEAARFEDADAATQQIIRVSTTHPLKDDFTLRRPLLDAEARIQTLEVAG